MLHVLHSIRPAVLWLLVVGLVWGGGCAPNRAPAARFVEQADHLHAGALQSTIVPDPELNEYVQTIGERLEKAAQAIVPDKASGPFFKSMKFHLVDIPVINVFTTGGSHIYVYRGLFDYCLTEEELAAAMAHAYAHALNLDMEQTGLNPPSRTSSPTWSPPRSSLRRKLTVRRCSGANS